ncbi:voltage-dependent calcium channel subunit alpha-2/delta-3-like [Saccostrea cucullata]|uniref:voltage-dependent calcium channel subunit alpha-2/delta-3-like n=1 Tax=Saccostrea cuccullata TaxID=36930 RepID=UPI002ED09A72
MAIPYLEKCETTNIQETVVRYWNVTYPPTGLLDIMESTAQIQHVNRQILAMEDRTMMIYPSPPSGISSEVVKHYSQLFASTLSPVEKDLVIVIDRSGSMAAVHGTKTLLQITIEAVTFVLETLTANDRIGIVVFDTGTVVPGAASRKCVGSKLAKATPENVKFYQSILQNIQIGARTNYELALREAFKFFKHSNYTTESEQREKIILFLTDGLPTVGKDPVKTIAEENKILNNSVAIFTYGIGQLLNDTIVDVLQKMSGQVESDPKYGIVRKGEFKKIANPSKLQDILASYWKPFRKSENRIRVSLPYDDKSNLGFITSLCKQLHKKDKKIFGMVCIDVRLSSLFREVFLLENVKNSYAFVIDGMGRTYIHSSLKPIALNSDAVIVDIESLERDEAVASILESMKRGETGSQRILSTRVSSRGNTFIDGVQERKMWSTYYWNPLKGTNLSLCVVITEGGGEVLYNASSPSPEKFNYHRLDLLTSTGGACNHFNRYASKEYSTVLLTPKAFVDPDFNLENEDINDVLSYTNFLSGKSSTDPGFKSSFGYSFITIPQFGNTLEQKTGSLEYIRELSFHKITTTLRDPGKVSLFPNSCKLA